MKIKINSIRSIHFTIKLLDFNIFLIYLVILKYLKILKGLQITNNYLYK